MQQIDGKWEYLNHFRIVNLSDESILMFGLVIPKLCKIYSHM
jgi:hypothetical protein